MSRSQEKIFSTLGPKLRGSKALQDHGDKLLQIRIETIDYLWQLMIAYDSLSVYDSFWLPSCLSSSQGWRRACSIILRIVCDLIILQCLNVNPFIRNLWNFVMLITSYPNMCDSPPPPPPPWDFQLTSTMAMASLTFVLSSGSQLGGVEWHYPELVAELWQYPHGVAWRGYCWLLRLENIGRTG